MKNISRAIGVFGLAAKDIEALARAGVARNRAADEAIAVATSRRRDTSRRSTSARRADGVQLAYSRMGSGPPLVKTGNWMTHLEFDFESPIWRHLYRELSRDHTLIRYDARGNGLSDRDVEEVSFETFVSDLEAVVDAAGLERFALLGISQGCAVSIAYAVRHPERVSHLVLLGGYALGWAKRARSAAEKEQVAAMVTLVRLGWGQENPAFRQLFTSQFIPGGSKEQVDWFNELQRISTSPEDAVRNLIANGDTDVSASARQVTVPTLVMHARDDARVPFDQGRRLAAGIPGARFVPLASRNHLILEDEPAFPRFLQEMRAFPHCLVGARQRSPHREDAPRSRNDRLGPNLAVSRTAGNRRVSPLASGRSDGPLSDHRPGVQPAQRELVFMPLSGHCARSTCGRGKQVGEHGVDRPIGRT